MSDYISRADAIEAFGLSEKTRKYGGDHSGYDTMLKYEIQDVLENLPSADAVQDGRNNIKRYPNCQMRTSLGNCDAIGGFCTSINAPICDAFHKLVEAVQGEGYEDFVNANHGLAKEICELKAQIESADVVKVVRCGECKYKRLYDDGDTKYYYCALEDRPNRNWSVDDTDYCSWGERKEE